MRPQEEEGETRGEEVWTGVREEDRRRNGGGGWGRERRSGPRVRWRQEAEEEEAATRLVPLVSVPVSRGARCHREQVPGAPGLGLPAWHHFWLAQLGLLTWNLFLRCCALESVILSSTWKYFLCLFLYFKCHLLHVDATIKTFSYIKLTQPFGILSVC